MLGLEEIMEIEQEEYEEGHIRSIVVIPEELYIQEELDEMRLEELAIEAIEELELCEIYYDGE